MSNLLPDTFGQFMLSLMTLLLGGGGIAGLVTILIKRKREPLEQEQIAAATDNIAVQNLQASHEAIHKDAQWFRENLSATREEVGELREELRLTGDDLNNTQNELRITQDDLRVTRRHLYWLQDVWSTWWSDLQRYWHVYRLQDQPPPPPDRQYGATHDRRPGDDPVESSGDLGTGVD